MALIMNSTGGAPAADTTETATGTAPGAAPGGDQIIDSNTEKFAVDVVEASNTVPVIVDFWAPWCGPCKTLGPLIEKLVREYNGTVRLVKINVDDNQALAQQLRVQSIPMVYAFKGGQPVDAFTGALPESQLRQFIEKLTGNAGSPLDQALEIAQAALAEDAQGAAQLYTQILQEDGKNAAAAAGLARALLAMGDVEEARQLIDGLPEEMQKATAVAAARSAIDLAEDTGGGNGGDAAELRARLEADGNDHQTRFALALALYGGGEVEHAIDELIEIVRRNARWNDEAARTQLLKMFDALGNSDPLTVAGRRKLSSVLFS